MREHENSLVWDSCGLTQFCRCFDSNRLEGENKYIFACCILQVYEDDVERNYQLLVELLIALKDVLRQDGLPFVKDLQAMWVLDVSSMETQNFSDIALGAWCSFLHILIVLWPANSLVWWAVHTSIPNQCLHQGGYLLATLLHNWHKPLYTKRGGKTQIKEPWVCSLLSLILLSLPMTATHTGLGFRASNADSLHSWSLAQPVPQGFFLKVRFGVD